MTKVLGSFHTSDGPQFAIAEQKGGGNYETVVVLSETEADGLSAGQLAFKHNVPQGNEPGQFSTP